MDCKLKGIIFLIYLFKEKTTFVIFALWGEISRRHGEEEKKKDLPLMPKDCGGFMVGKKTISYPI